MSGDPFEPTIERRNADLWAVCRRGECLGADGEWDYEPLPSSRTDEWKASHRFPLEHALRLARFYAPSVVACGMTAAERLAQINSGKHRVEEVPDE